ncbi:MAG: NAD-dependent epimerase/dehydratase family protein [Clostridiales bacterium]|nr:NAD-dependent epimerase/dehydratase family protein [Clostridiales bacterium]
MNALFIGGTGTISASISRLLIDMGWELTLINRGNRMEIPGAEHIRADINNEADVADKIKDRKFDVVADFICFSPDQAERDIRLFGGKTKQFFFISSASAYQKPLVSPIIHEATPLSNPFWEYSRKKAACEDVFMDAFRKDGFPITVVRPSHTFANRTITVPIHGKHGAWQVLKRMLEGKKVLVPGDGNTLWAVMASEDFAAAFVGLMGNIHAIGQAVQITSEELLTWNQIMDVIADALGVEYKPCYVPSAILSKCASYDFEGALLGDKSHTVIFDNTKLHRLVPGFTAQKRFDQSAPESVHYFLTHPENQVEDPEFDAFCDRVVEIMENAQLQISKL